MTGGGDQIVVIKGFPFGNREAEFVDDIEVDIRFDENHQIHRISILAADVFGEPQRKLPSDLSSLTAFDRNIVDNIGPLLAAFEISTAEFEILSEGEMFSAPGDLHNDFHDLTFVLSVPVIDKTLTSSTQFFSRQQLKSSNLYLSADSILMQIEEKPIGQGLSTYSLPPNVWSVFSDMTWHEGNADGPRNLYVIRAAVKGGPNRAAELLAEPPQIKIGDTRLQTELIDLNRVGPFQPTLPLEGGRSKALLDWERQQLLNSRMDSLRYPDHRQRTL